MTRYSIVILSLALLTFQQSGQCQENTDESPLFSLSGKVRDFETKKPIEGAMVILVPVDGISAEILTNKKGVYRFETFGDGEGRYILPNTSYTIKVLKKGYVKGIDEFTTKGEDGSMDFEMNFMLEKQPR